LGTAKAGSVNESEVHGGKASMRLLSYNIRHGEGMDNQVDLSRSANLISRLNPDVAFLQELDRGTERTGRVDQMRELGALTGLQPAFGKFMDFQGGVYGMGILSRYPLKASANHPLPPGSEPRSALAVRVEIPGSHQEMLCVGIHLFDTPKERLAQAQTLVELFKDETVPVILGGDFNSDPDSEVIRFLNTYWEIPDKGADRLSWRADLPTVEIDYIMYRPRERFRVIQCRLVDEPLVSDHRPLVVELALQNT
jgi:endonuclease/exonuclease/phosphatase family metal-dependent hydrolase